MERSNEPITYAVWHPDDSIRRASSSGGAFTLLAENVIKRGGVVFGAAWNDKLQVIIISVENIQELSKLRESKYVAAISGDEYIKAKNLLESGREVLYSGSPCQIAGLYSFLHGKNYPNLTTVDFICHGTPDRRVWEKYVLFLENKYKDKITNVHFRDKRWGVEANLLLKFTLLNRGVEKIISLRGNTYYHGFIHNIFMRKCCMTCRFNKIPRQADFSLADYRGLGEYIPFKYESDKVKGFTGVMVNSQKGIDFIKDLDMDTWIIRPFKELSSSQSMLYNNPKPHKMYYKFWNDFENKDWLTLEKLYLRPSWKYIVYIIMRRILGPNIFLRLGIIYKRAMGLRKVSWWVVK